MNDRQRFHETFDALQAPDGLLDRVLAQTERPRRHRLVRTALIAACLMLALTITILADTPDALVTHANARQVFQQEWQSLHNAGAFLPDIDQDAWSYRQEPQTDHFLCFHWEVDPNFYFSAKHRPHGYSPRATLDPDSGKITAFAIEAGNELMHPDWEPVQTVTQEIEQTAPPFEKLISWLKINVFGQEPPEPSYYTFKWYDHYELLMDPAMTAREFGQLWADYAEYDRFEVLGTDPDLPVLNDLSPLSSETYFAFQSPAGLHPVCMRLEFTSTASSVAVSFQQIPAEDLPADITEYGYQYGYLLRLCNRELSALYDLGLLQQELQFTADDYAPSNPHQSGTVRTNWKTHTKDEPFLYVQWNPATDQILYLSVTAPAPILPEDLTLGRLCELWTAYDSGFDRYALPAGAATRRYRRWTPSPIGMGMSTVGTIPSPFTHRTNRPLFCAMSLTAVLRTAHGASLSAPITRRADRPETGRKKLTI